MNPEHLLQHFERISEAPDAIPRLRRFILDLAVRGKLVGQDTNDEPAAELLKLVPKRGVTLTVPPGWISGAFGNLLEMQYGKGLPAKDRKEQGEIPVFGSNGVVGYTDTALTNKPAIIIGRKGSAGALNLCDGPSWTTDVAYFLVPPNYFNIRFLLFSLRTLDLAALGKGVKPGLSRSDTYQLQLAIPPLAEQHRIVARVDEIMAMCDQLEAAKTEREQSRDLLVAASLYHLNSPADTVETDVPSLSAQPAGTCRYHASFVFEHLPRLTTRPEHIKQLRQTILSLAVRGKLVSQDPSDEPVSSQLALNDHARKKTAQKDRRADVDLQQLLIPEEKWEVPASWAWRAVADIVLFIDYRGKTPSKVREGIRLITAKNVRKGFISLSPEEFLSESNYREWMTRGIPQEGDVLFTTEAPMGNATVVQLKERFALAQRVINFRPYGALDSNFLVLQLLAEPFQSILDKTATGLTAKGIKAAKLKRLPLSIPPLAEQHRIVARVDELMALCDQLEAQLTTAETDSHGLLEAVLHEALNPLLEVTE